MTTKLTNFTKDSKNSLKTLEDLPKSFNKPPTRNQKTLINKLSNRISKKNFRPTKLTTNSSKKSKSSSIKLNPLSRKISINKRN